MDPQMSSSVYELSRVEEMDEEQGRLSSRDFATSAASILGESRSEPAQDSSSLQAVSILISPIPRYLDNSSFARLGGVCDSLLLSHILPYLTAKELVILGSTCKYFYLKQQSKVLWDNLYRRDFIDQDTEENSADGAISALTQLENALRPYHQLLSAGLGNFMSGAQENNAIMRQVSSRLKYERRLGEYVQRMQRSKEDQRQMMLDVRRLDRIRNLEYFLDFTQVRLLGPLLLSSLFLSITLVCQKLDGLQIPYWSCAVPLATSFFYLLFSTIAIHYIKINQHSPRSSVKDLWTNLRGPLVYLYSETTGHSRATFWALIALCLLLLLQVGLAVVKLSAYVPSSFRDHLSWGVVFIPLWVLFCSVCGLPFSGIRMEAAAFVLAIVFLWIPLFILIVCICVRLDHVNQVRMAYVFIPFYVIESAVMLTSLGVFVTGLWK